MPLAKLDDLLHHEIQDLYDAEQQVEHALPKMASAAHNPELKSAFEEHLQQTKGQLERLRKVREHLKLTGEAESCKGMAGLIAEGEDFIAQDADPDVRDAALIAAAQRVEHYEIAAYGSACAFAESLGDHEVKNLLGQNLEQEKKTDDKLTKLAEGGLMSYGINKEARA